MSKPTASDIRLPCYEPEVSCGTYCYGGSVVMKQATYLDHARPEDVWVRGDDALALRTENERLKSMLTAARKNVDLCLLYHEAMYADEPKIMERKTAADRDLRDRIDAALAAGGE